MCKVVYAYAYVFIHSFCNSFTHQTVMQWLLKVLCCTQAVVMSTGPLSSQGPCESAHWLDRQQHHQGIRQDVLKPHLFFFFRNFTYFCTGFSPVVASGGSSLTASCRLLLAGAFLVAEHGSRVLGSQQLRLMGPRAQAQ